MYINVLTLLPTKLNSADLKPENLMLSSWNEEEAELKLVDFGCSLILNEDAIDGKRYPSTPAYDPPEKITNKSAPNFKSDVWAAGCILYIILTGTHVSISYAMISICPTV
jgi:serine/threonine protein kinase